MNRKKPTVWDTVKRIGDEVERLRVVDLPTFCMNLGLGISSFWNYSKLVTNKYPNIVFEHSLYKWVDQKDMNKIGQSAS